MDLNFYIETLIKNINWSNFFTALCGAFFGALGSYVFNKKSEKNKETENNIAYLNLLICWIGRKINLLLSFKQNELPKKEKELEEIKHTVVQSNIVVLKELTRNIINNFTHLNYDFNKIDFIVETEPTLFNYILQMSEDYSNLVNIIDEYNKFNDNRFLFNESTIYTYEDLVNNIEKQINIFIFMGNQAIKNLVKYGAIFYNKKKILQVNFSKDASAIINSIPIVEGWQYEIKDKSFFENYFPTIRKITQKINQCLTKQKTKDKSVFH